MTIFLEKPITLHTIMIIVKGNERPAFTVEPMSLEDGISTTAEDVREVNYINTGDRESCIK